MGALVLGLATAQSAAAYVKEGDPALPFTVTTFGGDKVSLDDLKGQVVVLNYWATWCAPCRVELPVLNDYFSRHPRHDLKILAVTVEGSVPAAKLKPLAAQLNFPLIAKLSGRGYGAIGGAVPTSYVIDRAGVVRYAKAGAFTAESFEDVVGPLLNKPPPMKVATAVAPGPPQPAKPVWVELPNASDLFAAYPVQAKAESLGGRAALNCLINWDGGLVDCVIASQEPAEKGFGEAGLVLAAKFRMQTAFTDGSSAVGTRLTIPIRFVPEAHETNVAVPRDIRFAEAAPEFRKFGGPGPYYPDRAARAGASGVVLLDCAAEAGTGKLAECAVAAETPQLYEFGAAALKMAKDGWITATPDPAAASGARRVRLTVGFKAPAIH